MESRAREKRNIIIYEAAKEHELSRVGGGGVGGTQLSQKMKKKDILKDYIYCVVPEKIHTHPIEGHWEFLGEEGS